MLQSIRDSVTGWAAGLLLFFIALAFVFWGIDFGSFGQNAAASINGEDIPTQQVRQAVQNQLTRYQQLYQKGVPPELETEIKRSVVNQLVRNEVLAQYTDDEGYRVGDEQLGKAIRDIEVFHENGRFSKELYTTRLAIQGQSAAAFQAQMRRALTITQMQEAISRTAFVTPSERAREQKLRNEKREVAHAIFPVRAFADKVEVDDAGIEIYYENNKADFMTAETVDIEVLELAAGVADAAASVSDEDLEAFYRDEVRAGRFSAPAERSAAHILVTVDDDTDDAAAEARAAELTSRAMAGEDFAELAAKNSDDAGSAAEGGDLGWNEEAALTGALRDAVFSMKAGEIRGPIKTEFGYHVVQLNATRGGTARPLAEVADELRVELAKRRAEERYFDSRDRLIEMAYESDGLIQPAAALDLEVKTIRGVTRSGGAGVAADSKVIDAVFSPRVLDEGANSDLLDLDDTRSVVVRVINRQPSRQLPLSEVRPRIEAVMKNRAARDAARDAGRQVLEAVQRGAALGEVAQANAGEYREPVLAGRNDAALSPALREQVFAAPRPDSDRPSAGSVALPNGDFAVFAVLRIVDGAVSDADPELLAQASAQMGAAEFNALTEALTKDAKVVVRLDQIE